MDLSDLLKEDLEAMSYDEIALIILQRAGKKMKLAEIFKEICQVLELSESVYEAHLMDFFEQMSINKKFVMLENGYWDLQSRHKPNIVIEDDIVEDNEAEDDEILDEEDDKEEDSLEDEPDIDDDPEDDDLSDLMIVDEDEEE